MTQRQKRRLIKLGVWPAFLVVAWIVTWIRDALTPIRESNVLLDLATILTVLVYVVLAVVWGLRSAGRTAGRVSDPQTRQDRNEALAEVNRWRMHDSRHSTATLLGVYRGVRKAQRRNRRDASRTRDS